MFGHNEFGDLTRLNMQLRLLYEVVNMGSEVDKGVENVVNILGLINRNTNEPWKILWV